MAAVVLLLATSGKAFDLPLFAGLVIRTFPFLIGHAAFAGIALFAAEATIGVMLLLSPRDCFWRRSGAAIYTTFGFIHLILLYKGSAPSCGCFGIWQGAWLIRIWLAPLKACLVNLGIATTLLLPDFLATD